MEEIKKLIRFIMRREYARGKYMAYLRVTNYLTGVRFIEGNAPGYDECISALLEHINEMRADAFKELEEVRNER